MTCPASLGSRSLCSAFLFLLLGPPGFSQSKQDARAALDVHNALRQDVGTPPLHWSARLAQDAKGYARRLARGNCRLRHAAVPEGENLWASWGSPGHETNLPFRAASLSWGEEIRDYRGQPIGRGRFAAYGHYTQMIWKDTREVGMAMATGRNGCVVVVARYWPAGNVMGDLPTH